MIAPDSYSSEHKDDSIIERILRKVPGFRGYLRQEDRQQSDQKTRDYLDQQLSHVLRGLDEHVRQLTDQGQLERLDSVERVRAHVQRVSGKVRSSLPASTGFFSLGSIDENRVEDLHDVDQTLIQQGEHLADQAKTLGANADSARLQHISESLLRFEEVYERRSQQIKQL